MLAHALSLAAHCLLLLVYLNVVECLECLQLREHRAGEQTVIFLAWGM